GLSANGDTQYTIIAGARRHAAIKLAIEQTGTEETRRTLARVPVVLSHSAEAERRVLQLIENLQREDLRPVEEARALKELMRLENLTTMGIAARIHRSQGYIDERLRLLRHEDVEEAAEVGLLTASAAAAVASLGSAEERQAWLERAKSGERVAPDAVYRSKANRRRKSAGQSAAESPPDTAPISEERVQALREAEPELSVHEARHLAALEAAAREIHSTDLRVLGTEAGAASPASRPRIDEADPLPKFGNRGSIAGSVGRSPLTQADELPNFGNEQPIPGELDPPDFSGIQNPQASIDLLLRSAGIKERALVQRVLAAGVLFGLSCEEVLRLVGTAP
ncbi:MAG: ParB/RepB/Spo0J family partition protein, partial [Chloroflexota bacterium]